MPFAYLVRYTASFTCVNQARTCFPACVYCAAHRWVETVLWVTLAAFPAETVYESGADESNNMLRTAVRLSGNWRQVSP
jgi:hypothetical protein